MTFLDDAIRYYDVRDIESTIEYPIFAKEIPANCQMMYISDWMECSIRREIYMYSPWRLATGKYFTQYKVSPYIHWQFKDRLVYPEWVELMINTAGWNRHV